jgi:hypothetical protein
MTNKDARQRLCDKLLGMEIKSFSISDKGNTEEIETFTRLYTALGASDVDLEKGNLKFHNFGFGINNLIDIMRAISDYKTIRLTSLEFEYRGKWVQDAKTVEVSKLIKIFNERNAQYIQNTGSQYITGPSRSGRSDEIGIYFTDPTSLEFSII